MAGSQENHGSALDYRASEEIVDVRTLAMGYWSARWVVLIAVILGLLFGLRSIRSHQPVFEASMVISPIAQPSASGGGGGAGVVGGLMALGLSVGRSATQFDRFRLVLESIEFSGLLEEKHGLLRRLFASSWDSEKNEWRRPQADSQQSRSESLRSALRMRPWRPPDIAMLAGYLKSGFKFRQIDGGQFHRIVFSHPDPDFALWFLRSVYDEAESMLRRQDAEESNQRIAYLSEQLRKATVIEVRQALAGLLTSEERQAMLMQGDLPFIGKVVVSPYVDPSPSEPEIAVVLGSAVLVGVGLSLVFATVIVIVWGGRGRKADAPGGP